MKRFYIKTKRVYQQNGGEKTAWLDVGSVVDFDATAEKKAGKIINLNMFPDTKFYVFEAEEKQQ